MKKFISIAVLFLMNTQLFGWSGGFMGASKNITGNVTITGNLTTTGDITVGDTCKVTGGVFSGNGGGTMQLTRVSGTAGCLTLNKLSADSARVLGGVIAAAVKADSSIVGDLITARDSIYEVSGRVLEFGGPAGYAAIGYLRVENNLITNGPLQSVGGIVAYPATTPSITGFKTLSVGFADVDSFNVGGGATITKIDTSAAGDSTKLDFPNGNRIMHLGTEVKAP